MEYINLIIENWDIILEAVTKFIAATVGILTLINQFMPKVISHKTLARIESVTSKFSLGTKKAEIVKK